MTAAQVIEEIKALPPQEQAEVVEFVIELKTAAVRYATEEEFKAAAGEVFEHHRELLRKLAS